MRLENKMAVIVGGASEMAMAAGRMFLKEGASLFLIDCNEKGMADFKNDLPAYAGRITTYTADVTSCEQMGGAMAAAEKKLGRIDILVNTAGIIRHHPIDEMTFEDWQSVINVNLTGYFNSCKGAVPYMKKCNYGKIVNISSIGGRTGRPGVGVNYAAAKAGIVGMTMLLAKELASSHITVNAIAPGPLKGKMFDSMTPENQKNLSVGIPLGFLGDMDQIAYAITYLASDESAYATGEVLDINGGLYM